MPATVRELLHDLARASLTLKATGDKASLECCRAAVFWNVLADTTFASSPASTPKS
ncbi:MAG: hypothetical protein R3D81_17175 [Thalassovita sp.]